MHPFDDNLENVGRAEIFLGTIFRNQPETAISTKNAKEIH